MNTMTIRCLARPSFRASALVLAAVGLTGTSFQIHAQEISAVEARAVLIRKNIVANGMRWPLKLDDSLPAAQRGVKWLSPTQVHRPVTANGLGFGDCWASPDCAAQSSVHTGVDLNTHNDCNRKVYAAADGVVRYAQLSTVTEWGGIILLQHRMLNESGQLTEIATQYGHVVPVRSLAVGAIVHMGQHIGYIAPSTQATCAALPDDAARPPAGKTWAVGWLSHLHFEVRKDLTISASQWHRLPAFNSAIDARPVSDSCTGAGATGVLRQATGLGLLCRRKASAALGYLDPFEVIASNEGFAGTDVLWKGAQESINKCIAASTETVGARVGRPRTAGDWILQRVSGTAQASRLGWVASHRARPEGVGFYWNGWGFLSTERCKEDFDPGPP